MLAASNHEHIASAGRLGSGPALGPPTSRTAARGRTDMRVTRPRLLIVAAVAVLTLASLGWWIFGPTGFVVELTQRSWRMEIEVERLRLETGTDWCDELPEGASGVVRRTITDPTGRRAGPAEHCKYSVLAWRRSWIAREQGLAGTRVDWPRPPLRVAPPGEPGSERLGRREAYYELTLRDGDGHEWTCRTDLDRWNRLKVGQRFRLPVDRWSTANCGLLG